MSQNNIWLFWLYFDSMEKEAAASEEWVFKPNLFIHAYSKIEKSNIYAIFFSWKTIISLQNKSAKKKLLQ